MKYLALALLTACASTSISPDDCVQLYPPIEDNCEAITISLYKFDTCWTRQHQILLANAHDGCREHKGPNFCANFAMFGASSDQWQINCIKVKPPMKVKIQRDLFFRDRDIRK